MRIQPRAHRRPADSQIVKPVQRLVQPFDVAIEQTGPAAEFLSKGQWDGILQMGAANLHDIFKFLRLGCDRIAHRLDRRNQRVLHPLRRSNVHCRWKGVVRRLRHVDVIVRMYRLLRSHFAARNLNRTIRDDLVHVHVGLRAAAGLPNAQRKLVIQLTGNDFVGSFDDELGLVGREFAQVLIHQRAGLLERAKGANQLRRHGVAPNIEMQQRAFGLRPPVNMRRDLNLPHAVGFGAGLSMGRRGGFGKCRHNGVGPHLS